MGSDLQRCRSGWVLPAPYAEVNSATPVFRILTAALS
jgi:hypothetical protein